MNKPYKILDKIYEPKDLKQLSVLELNQLAQDLRTFIIEVVATKEGHLGASLGVVELTLALHYCLNTPQDLLVWDVGHQAYVHKILTKRKDLFETNRQFGGLSGFPKRDESEYDTFGVGHASTSISAALGIAMANQINNTHHQVVAVIGDASIVGGMAFEALNHAGVSDTDLLVILNDNAIGIDPSVGALKSYLTNLKTNQHKAEQNLFEALNFSYFGPIDGHNLEVLIANIEKLKTIKGPKLLHVVTTKGKGLKQAEDDQVLYHAPGKFNHLTGDIIVKENRKHAKFQDVFGKTLVQLAQNDTKIVAITPAMPTGSSLNEMINLFPERAFDVGIAEQHAVTFAAGLATQNLKVFCVIYSTFLQRAYDQIIHDVCIQNLPVIFCIDRAGLVGQDGATHHGVFDIAFLRCIPSIQIIAPRNETQLRQIMYAVTQQNNGPVAIRYPRGYGLTENWNIPFQNIDLSLVECLQKGTKIAILTTGFTAHLAQEAIDLSRNYEGKVSLYHVLCLKPLNKLALAEILNTYTSFITLEDGTTEGGFGDAIIALLNELDINKKVHKLGVPDNFIEHGTVLELQIFCKFDSENLAKLIKSILHENL